MDTAATPICLLLSTEGKKKIVDVSRCVTNGQNMGRLSFTQNEREECDKTGRSSSHHHRAAGSIVSSYSSASGHTSGCQAR